MRTQALGLFLMSFTIVATGCKSGGGGGGSSPAKSTSTTTVTQKKTETILKPDTNEQSEAVFAKYPWGLPSTREAADIAKLGISIDYSADDFKKYWRNEFPAWTAAESKTLMENAIRARLKNAAAALDAPARAGLVSNIKIGSGHRYNKLYYGAKERLLLLPVYEVPTERLERFLTQTAWLSEISAAKFDGLPITVEYMGDLSSTFTLERVQKITEDFATSGYPLIRNSLRKYSALINSIAIANHNDFSPPVEFRQVGRGLVVNMTTLLKQKNVAALVDGYLDALLTADANGLLSKVVIQTSMRYVLGHPNSSGRSEGYHDADSVIRGLQAVATRAQEILSLTDKNGDLLIRAIRFETCQERSPALQRREPRPCGGLNQGTLALPVAEERYPTGLFPVYQYDFLKVVKELDQILQNQPNK